MPIEMMTSFYRRLADWVVNSHVDPRSVIRELIRDVTGEQLNRRPRFTRDPEYREFAKEAIKFGGKARQALSEIGEMFKRDDPASQTNIDRNEHRFAGVGH